jgi:hypothetical protein
MKNLFIFAVICIIGWQAYKHETKRAPEAPVAETAWSPSTKAEAPSSVAYRCDGRKHCSQMTSCQEATYFLRNCPGVKMDGDHDGVPCEEQWCR